jgi:hypothetical protein
LSHVENARQTLKYGSIEIQAEKTPYRWATEGETETANLIKCERGKNGLHSCSRW